MSRLQEHILANAAYHTHLLTEISNLQYVLPAKNRQTSYIEDIRKQLAAIQKEIPQLVEETNKKKKKHEARRDATVSRFANKFLGKTEKYDVEVHEKESEYVEALQKQVTAQNGQSAVEELLNEAHKELINLSDKEQQLFSLKAELTALYGRVFDGPTAFLPEDDRLEHALHAARKRHGEIEAIINSESRAVEQLAKAMKYMDACQNHLQYAMESGSEHFGSFSTPSLKLAQANASQVERFVKEAIQASPLVVPVTIRAEIPDHGVKGRIGPVLVKAHWRNQELKFGLSNAQFRVNAACENLVQASGTVEHCRQELHEFRKATFEGYIKYSEVWQIAKNETRRHIALVHAFPEQEKLEASLILTKAITEYRKRNQLDDRFTPDRDLETTSILIVSQEYSNFRSQMKEVAREVVKSKYSDVFLTPGETVKKNVIGILNEGRFLRGGIDENGKTKNLCHPAIEALALQIYYTGDDCLANLFPEDFERTVPDHALALLLTCIQNCLEEYVDHGHRLASGINFGGDKYRGIYENYLEMIKHCKKNEYHGPRFENCRAEWARKGMSQRLGQLKGPTGYVPTGYMPTLHLD